MPPYRNIDRACDLLSDLIALQTVNPMGRSYNSDTPVERPVVEYLERHFSKFDVKMKRIRCSPIHESLLITIPGSTGKPGTLLEAHVDTVPADDWSDRAFLPRRDGRMVIGRGACDDKGALAAMVLALTDLLESEEPPFQTVWLLAAGDEEYAQSGIKSFIEGHSADIGRAIVGEPTDCIPVIQHKGMIRWDITIHGRSAHTSQPEGGRNAILDALRIVTALSRHEEQLRGQITSSWISGPTLTVTMINGGRTRNTVPDECVIAVDFRILPGMDGKEAIHELHTALGALEIPITHSNFQCYAPPLNTSPDHPFVQAVLAICRQELGLDVKPAAAPYGSDACWIPNEVPALLLGPGNIAKAHAVDECVALDEVAQCACIYRQALVRDWTGI